MSIQTKEATIEDLYNVPEHSKAEIINGEVVLMSPTGGLLGRSSGKIFMKLVEYESHHQNGYAFGDNVGFIVDLPNRKSFSPDAAFYSGDITMKFLEGAPLCAVEVRSAGDYGPAAEQEMANKRADYFTAGTQVVWGVDLMNKVVRVYRATTPDKPTIYQPGNIAEAEPALPGWSMPVNEILP